MSQFNELVVRISGEGGEGVISTGEFITQASARSGHYVYNFNTYPAEIKGGNVAYQVRISKERVYTQGSDVHVFVAFNELAYNNHIHLLKMPYGVLVYDSDSFTPEPMQGRIDYAIPLTSLAKDEVGSAITKNVVTMGVFAGLFGLPYDSLKALVTEKFSGKGEKILDMNLKALEVGKTWCENNLKKIDANTIGEGDPKRRGKAIFMTGSEATGLGAIAAGLDAFFGYPITPGTDVFKFLAKQLPKRAGGRVMQMEDEIASIAACIGGSFGGKKTMTATSGPGLSLMSELLGYSSMAELPLVIVNVQRGGPSTGLPTKPEQSDLNIALYGSHGEAPRAVIAPHDVEDCFYQTIRAFNIAERYQVPVIVLTDAFLGTRKEAFEIPDFDAIELWERKKNTAKSSEEYNRYEVTEDGVSPISEPGDPNGIYTAAGLEHSEKGWPSYDGQNHCVMQDKRYRKMDSMLKALEPCEVFGDEDAKVGFLTWGSTAGACHEAVVRLRKMGHKCKFMAPKILSPLPVEEIQSFLDGMRMVIIPELNYLGQFAQLVRLNCACPEIIAFNKYNCDPFSSTELVEKYLEVKNQ
jgi:2-oxoglutarate ferredoxin oxidoreductase subunit alpha